VRIGRSVVAGWLALVGLGTTLAFAARGGGPLPGDLTVTRLLQQLATDGLVSFLLVRAGDAIWFLPPLAILIALLLRRWLDALAVLLASSTGVLVGNVLIKALVERPSAELVRVSGSLEGYGFPSGTAFFAVVLLGMIVYLVWRTRPPHLTAVLTLGISLLLILLGVLSRVYTGEHWATDVLGGWLLGSAWLLVLVAAYRWWSSGRASDPT
jgi:membrane-associated phospholipid phosphatase